MPTITAAFYVVSVVALLGACDDLAGPESVVDCSGWKSCQAADCYSECFCASADTAACERECGPRGVRVSDLDEDTWTDDWAAHEEEVVALTNAAREKGACCGGEGCFDPAPPLEVDPALRKSARGHALDMSERGYFEHDSPDGLSPFDRMREAGFMGCAMGENIAAGQSSASDVVRTWLGSPGHCANMLKPSFERIGVGYHPAARGNPSPLWVQNFGAL
jgi:uncharacterized protein YkwD